MRKFIASSIALVLFLSGCTFSFEVMTPAPSVNDSALTPYSTEVSATPVATFTPTAVPVAPILAGPGSDPIFFNGRAASTPDAVSTLASFGPGTKKVYVIWDYQNMSAGMMVRREWYLNGQPWLTREEPWDFAKYGSTGTMRDVSIYDDVAGLSNGSYFLRVYIDNVVQPLGSMFGEPIDEWVNFDIGANEADTFMGYGSPDGQWGVEVYGGTRIMLKNVTTGEYRQIIIVQNVVYVTWFADSKHFLFVDRYPPQESGAPVRYWDHLWIVDAATGEALRVFKGDNSFAGHNGPVPSPNGKYIASMIGSDYGDACAKDMQMIFFQVAPDFRSVTSVYQQNFTGLPAFNESWIYPMDDGYWENDNTFRVTLDGTCNPDRSQLGSFRFDLLSNTASRSNAPVDQPVPGDLGIGSVHGKITDGNGTPIPNATVTCEHSSYRPESPCTGTVSTAADGSFAFTNVFFHDTDTITVTVQGEGYETKEVSQSFFTVKDWEVNIMLNSTP
jgi:hypothetical protein